MVIDAYQSKNKPNKVYVRNIERLSEESVFETVLSKLRKNKYVSIGIKQEGPSEDYYSCSYKGIPFMLFFDIDYGTELYVEDVAKVPDVIQMLTA